MRRASLGVVLAAVVLGAFFSAPVTSSPPAVDPGSSPVREWSQRALTETREFRLSIGLRADEAWIARVWSDPASVERYNTWVSPSEAEDLDSRARTLEEMTTVLSAYRLRASDTWAGSFVDNRASGVVVLLVTDDPEPHRAALQEVVSPDTRFDVRRVRFTLAELEAKRDVIVAGDDWFAEVGLDLRAVAVDIASNRVHIEVKTADPNAGDHILARFDAHDWVAIEILPPTPVFEVGSLVIEIVTPSGEPALDVHCVLAPDVAGALGDWSITSSRNDGDCDFPEVPAIGYWAEISKDGQPESPLLARSRATVAPGRNTVLRVVIPLD